MSIGHYGNEAPRSAVPLSPSASSSATHPLTRSSPREPGTGHLHLTSSSSSASSSSSRPDNRARFTSLLASYPLKLLTPTPLPSQPAKIGVVYTLAYGGGLVAGDIISLSVDIDQGCGLVMLTQGSTKVFKRRPGIRPLSHSFIRTSKRASGTEAVTKQRMKISLSPGSFLLLLPDSISPFASSRYAQAQRFILPEDGSASILILDWVNSGRGQRPQIPPNPPSSDGPNLKRQGDDGHEGAEIWSMDRYASTNEVYIGERLIMRERMVLDNTHEYPITISPNQETPRPERQNPNLSLIARQLAPYNIYATMLILGPRLTPLIDHLKSLCDQTRQFQIPRPPELIWSFSEVENGRGGILRLAATEVEDARVWLRSHLKAGRVDQLVGDGLWPRLI